MEVHREAVDKLMLVMHPPKPSGRKKDEKPPEPKDLELLMKDMRVAVRELEKLAPPEPRDARALLVRRLHARPIALPPLPRQEPDGWLALGGKEGSVIELVGPHLVNGGWWRRPLERAYHFARLESGRWLWLYDDRVRRRRYLQGEVA